MISSTVEQPCSGSLNNLNDCQKSQLPENLSSVQYAFQLDQMLKTAKAANEASHEKTLTQDQIWVQQFQSGKTEVFNHLVHKYERKLRNMVSRIIFHRDDVDDILQETWLSVYKALKNFRGDAQFYSWLYRIAQNTAISAVKREIIKKKAFEPSSSDKEFLQDSYNEDSPLNLTNPSYSPEEHLLDQQLTEKLEEGISQLSKDLRETFVYREMHGLSYQQIADIQAIPIGTVRSRINRARDIITHQKGLEDINLVPAI
ncbi:sigma-70 family RNA polymerase sigma factor [Litoribrevibacter euphylliae]|uniref:Sigma-70 family RNA polymerase sigma factor n=1 Tax=Litoribrevibacter euphylliae TaxID=1834034 RepID=A0ABV7HGC1_9GAMM